MNACTCLLILTSALALQYPSPALGQAPHQYSRMEENAAQVYPDYFTLDQDSIRITLLEEQPPAEPNYVMPQEPPARNLAGVLVALDNIVNVAQRLWELVADNRPVANLETVYATAYPQGVTSAAQLSGWSRPRTYTYGFYAENLLGLTMVDVRYRVSFAHDGNLGGAGKYLTAVTAVPASVEVSWGYHLSMAADVPDSTITNVGTAEAPVAALQLRLRWTISTILKGATNTNVYYMQGDGFYQEIASPYTRRGPDAARLRAAERLLEVPGAVFAGQ